MGNSISDYASECSTVTACKAAVGHGTQPSQGSVSDANTRNLGTQASPTQADLIGDHFTCELDQASSGVKIEDSSFTDQLKRLRGEFVIEYDAEDRAGNKAQQLVFAMIMVDDMCPTVTRDESSLDVEACDIDKDANNRNDAKSRNQVTTNERLISWEDNYDGQTPFMSAATADVRNKNLFYEWQFNQEAGGWTSRGYSEGHNGANTDNLQAFYNSFDDGNANANDATVRVVYTAEDYANIFGAGYTDNECTTTDTWDIKDSIAPRVVQRLSKQQPVCPHDESSAIDRCTGTAHTGPSLEESRWSASSLEGSQRFEVASKCQNADKIFTTGNTNIGRSSCQCYNFRRAWGTTTNQPECKAYTSGAGGFLYSGHGDSSYADDCSAINTHDSADFNPNNYDIPVTYFECGDLDGFQEMGFKCIDMRDSYASDDTDGGASSGFTATGTWSDTLDGATHNYQEADSPKSYFVDAHSAHITYGDVEYSTYTEDSAGTGTLGALIPGASVLADKVSKDTTLQNGYGNSQVSSEPCFTFHTDTCASASTEYELPLFNHGAAFAAVYKCTDRADHSNTGSDNNEMGDADGANIRITKVVDTLAPTLRINAQGMEQLNSVTHTYYADHTDSRFDKTKYSLWKQDNSQNAFADNTADNGEALKKMNSHYHDQDYIDGNARKTISTFTQTKSQYTVLSGHEKGKAAVSDSCDRSGKVWRKDWKDKTWQMGSHVSDDANAGWDVDSYTIQHSAGFDSDEAVITHLQDPYVGYSCFDQCDGDLTHVADHDNSVTNGVTLTWHNGDENGAKRGCEGTVLSSGFQTLVPGTYALKYSCEDAAGHVTTKCRTILNEDHPKPIITVLEADQQTYEATRSDNYVDAGATCSDEVDGNISQDVEVSGDVVNLARVGVYTIKYNCQDSAANTADEATRTVSIEASFPYNDVGAVATDSLQGSFGICSVWDKGVLKSSYKEIVNVESTGTYYITYRVKDSNGNWNDNSGCTGGQTGDENVRTVVIIDTLRPVIQLKYGGNVIHEGAGSFASGAANANRGNTALSHTQEDATGDPVHLGAGNYNPAQSQNANPDPYTHTWSHSLNLMAEQATTSSVNGWVIGAVGSAVTGLALLGYSLRKSAAPVATSVPV